MCTQCLVFSALTLFLPGPQPADVAPVSVSPAAYNQVNTPRAAKEMQVAIAAMLKHLPNSPDLRLLREGLNVLYARLATVKDDAEAQELIDNSLRSLSEQLRAEPNAEKISELLMAMLEVEESEPSVKSLGFKMLQHPNFRKSYFQSKGNSWGWLK